VDLERRWRIMKNHTATHLLHAALRKTLGPHVHQKGSLVAPDRLRFDFTHTSPMTDAEVEEVEMVVNEHILHDEQVNIHQDIPIAEAKSRGAMALFGEKYGDKVRMVEIPDVSLELCGGTHLQHTSQAGLFKIMSETGVSSGVRRIEAVTGAGVLALMKEQEERLELAAKALKSNPRDLLVAIDKLQIQRASLEKQVQQLKSGGSDRRSELQEQMVDGVKLLTGVVPDADGETLSLLADRAASGNGSMVVVVGSNLDGKAVLTVKVTPDLVKRGVHAGVIVREAAKITGGGGGGRPDFAQAGGRDASKLTDALAAVPDLVKQQLGAK
jgi:alanyl-tRNA synthetase